MAGRFYDSKRVEQVDIFIIQSCLRFKTVKCKMNRILVWKSKLLKVPRVKIIECNYTLSSDQCIAIFSNNHVFFFREFYYIQMEKYARQALSEGIKNAEDIHVSIESELYRVLNLHYNRNNHIEVSYNLLYSSLSSKQSILSIYI